MTQEITHQAGEFRLTIDGVHGGELTYTTPDEQHLIITHTGVDPAFRGQGLGVVLVRALTEHARQTRRTVVPRCSYAAAMYRKNPELADVLTPQS